MTSSGKRRGTATSLSMLAVAWDVVDDLVVIAMDVAKCFPTADRDVMLLELAKLGVWGDAWRLIANLDEGLKGRVLISGVLSEFYPVEQGFLEGDTSCPTKCNVMMGAVLVALRAAGLGVKLHGVWVGASLFLDDKLLIARGMPMAQAMLVVVRRVVRDHCIGISAPKSIAVRRRPRRFLRAVLRMEGMVGGQAVVGSDTIDLDGLPPFMFSSKPLFASMKLEMRACPTFSYAAVPLLLIDRPL
jgi:hypothetical protein